MKARSARHALLDETVLGRTRQRLAVGALGVIVATLLHRAGLGCTRQRLAVGAHGFARRIRESGRGNEKAQQDRKRDAFHGDTPGGMKAPSLSDPFVLTTAGAIEFTGCPSPCGRSDGLVHDEPGRLGAAGLRLLLDHLLDLLRHLLLLGGAHRLEVILADAELAQHRIEHPLLRGLAGDLEKLILRRRLVLGGRASQ